MTKTTNEAPPAGSLPPVRPRSATVTDRLQQPVSDQRARARAYLDLWERQLTHVAIEGPPVPPAPVPSPLDMTPPPSPRLSPHGTR